MRGIRQLLTSPGAATTPREDLVIGGLGAWLIVGVFLDGWAHTNKGGMETFFTPWHGVLYSGAAAVFGYLLVLCRRRFAIPAGYATAAVGAPLFLVAGGGDLLWHELFGLEVGIDALLSPTHLLLLASGLLALSGPWQADRMRGPGVRAPTVLSLALMTSLCTFFLLYTSPFEEPLAAVQLRRIPEGAPGHFLAELPAIAGLAQYLITTLLLVVPVLLLIRRGRPPRGSITTLLAGVTALAASVGEFEQPFAPLAAALAGAAVEVVAARTSAARPAFHVLAVSVTLPLVLWPAQLVAVALRDGVRWPIELWSGAVVLTTGVAAGLGYLSLGTAPAPKAVAAAPGQARTAPRPRDIDPAPDRSPRQAHRRNTPSCLCPGRISAVPRRFSAQAMCRARARWLDAPPRRRAVAVAC